MKKILFAALLLTSAAEISAQKMNVNLTDGTTTTFKVKEVTSVTMEEAEEPRLNVVDFAGNTIVDLPTEGCVEHTVQVVVDNNVEYKLTLPEWITETTVDEPTEGVLYLKIAANEAETTRSGQIVLTSTEDESVKVSIAVTQNKQTAFGLCNPQAVTYLGGGYINLCWSNPAGESPLFAKLDHVLCEWYDPRTGKNMSENLTSNAYNYKVTRARYGRTYKFKITPMSAKNEALDEPIILDHCYSMAAAAQYRSKKVQMELNESNVYVANAQQGYPMTNMFDGDNTTDYCTQQEEVTLADSYITIDLGEAVDQIYFEIRNSGSDDIPALDGIDLYMASKLEEQGTFKVTIMNGASTSQSGTQRLEYPLGCTSKKTTVADTPFRYFSINSEYTSTNDDYWGVAELRVYKIQWELLKDPEDPAQDK